MFINILTGEKIELIDEIIAFFSERNYQIVENQQIIYKEDHTVLFVGAPITFYKEEMRHEKDLGKILHVQEVLRTKGLDSDDCNFSMHFILIGLIADIQFNKEIFSDYLTILNKFFEIDLKKLYGATKYNYDSLIELWLQKFPKNNLQLFEKKNERIKLDWKYGDEYPLVGRGITVRHINSSVSTEYINIGDVIEIYCNEKKKYIEIGLGYERTMACKFGNSVYDIPNRKNIIKLAVTYGFSELLACQILGLFEAVYVLHINGINLANKGRGYVLKKIVRKSFDLLLQFVDYNMEKIDSQFLLFMKAWEFYYIRDYTIDEIVLKAYKSFKESIYKNIKRIDICKATDQEYIYHTFGIKKDLLYNIQKREGR